MKRLTELKLPLSIILSEHGMADNLTSRKCEILNYYVKVLEPFKEATEIMSAETYPTLSRYLPLVIGIEQTIQSISAEHSNEMFRDFIKNIITIFKQRFHFAYTCEPCAYSSRNTQ